MPTDATGTPTSLGIRKYNTSADAPSGLGFNGAMDDIDALIVARVLKPAGVAAGDVPVWNGSTWVVPTGARDGTKFLRDDGSWQAAGSTAGTEVMSTSITTTATTTSLVLVDLVTIGTATFTAVKHLLEVMIPNLRNTVANGTIFFQLLVDGVATGNSAQIDSHATASTGISAFIRQEFTPTAASHTIKVQWKLAGAGTGSVVTTGLVPALFRVVKA